MFQQLRSSHYTSDFSRNISFPHHARQPRPVYFKTAQKYSYSVYAMKDCPSRVIICLTKQIQLDLMVQAAMHGLNAVISMLHHYFANHDLKEEQCTIYADNMQQWPK